VPEKEIFGGQGGHYLYVLSAISLVLFIAFSLVIGKRLGFEAAWVIFPRSTWFWFYLIASCLPLIIGIYYWLLLRDEEITITDHLIARRSHWGEEEMAWDEVESYYRQPILFRQTRLGRIAWFSRLFTQHKLIAKLPPIRYELVSKPDPVAERRAMSLEPGAIDEMDWLLQLIEERVGPPTER
jgi:hypothetical protein